MKRLTPVLLIVLILVTAAPFFMVQPRAQSSPDKAAVTEKLAFEVASIKQNRTPNDKPFVSTKNGLTATSVQTRALIELAYHIQDVRLSGGPAWIDSERYDVDAKIDDAEMARMQKLSVEERAAELRMMVQSLLADRFKLKVSHATKELPIYQLVIAKNGPKLNLSPEIVPSGNDAAPPEHAVKMVGNSQVNASRETMNDLTGVLSVLPELYGRVVVDKTGLQGKYDFTLQWKPQIVPAQSLDGAAGIGTQTDSSGSSIFTALQEQLGLRLKSTKGPVDVVVIDHIEEPSPN